ncbi:hypothetical protein NQ318_022082 [Aromia moschata]|uniref:Gustatory receptor n=1 Tax=Aromia moschata TaxID=1265417 RepID=A0AAV8Z7B2_9CUCU|nr:hypothetical protein NQ318_022082 [Aromia moschata]
MLIGVENKNNTSIKKTAEEDYYLNYDYDISNNSVDAVFQSDSLILPNPETVDSKYPIDVLPNIELPDDTLADSDLRDHDVIDNVMYIYYGSHNRSVGSYGPEITIIGSVLSCAAQLLTIFCVLLKKNQNGDKTMKYIFFQIMGSLCLSNLIFMLGVYVTVWLFLYCFYIYTFFSTNGLIKIKHLKIKYLNIAAYDIPTFITLVNILFYITEKLRDETFLLYICSERDDPELYATSFRSNNPDDNLLTERNKKINMELSKLEFNSSAESLNALRHELETASDRKESIDEEVISLWETKTCLKLLCAVQTSYDIVWFIVVLALENVNDSTGMAIIFAITSCLLNWYIFIRRKCLLPTIYLPEEVITDDAQKRRGEKYSHLFT